jgi:hypothetical protein
LARYGGVWHDATTIALAAERWAQLDRPALQGFLQPIDPTINQVSGRERGR